MATDRSELQVRLNRRFAWALKLYERTMKMQGKEWKGIRQSSTPEQLADWVVEFKTNAFRTFVHQATGASRVRVEYYELDPDGEIAAVFKTSTLGYDEGANEHIVRLPTAWLTNEYASIYRPLNAELERALVAIWQAEGCPDAPDGG
jgi:hypothetical protein